MNDTAASNRSKALHFRLSGMTYAQIGKELGISRQRVQQLVSPPKAVRDLVVSRANGECERCSIRVGRSGQVHHSNASNGDTFNEIENLQLLCIPCHLIAHSPNPPQGIVELTCLRCDYQWHPRSNEKPVRCPKCGSPYWDRERKTPAQPNE
ncbi:hypothetical protein LCGC14_0792990 [marine sediment metagenome]|uniref:HNH nuclease domain-containing protein n=1 Tax=marine sediment metagenome TaxID=412755 RepID=A0A0F9PW99_9ZZZZ